MTTTENRILKVTPNRDKRHFTLRFYYTDRSIIKYRTLPMSKEEFLSAENWTDSDWRHFLKTDEYYKV